MDRHIGDYSFACGKISRDRIVDIHRLLRWRSSGRELQPGGADLSDGGKARAVRLDLSIKVGFHRDSLARVNQTRCDWVEFAKLQRSLKRRLRCVLRRHRTSSP